MRSAEEDLIARACEGDTRSFDRLKTQYETHVVRVCSGLLRNPQEGEEAAQETFLQAWKHLADYRGDGPFLAWLLYILYLTARLAAGWRGVRLQYILLIGLLIALALYAIPSTLHHFA